MAEEEINKLKRKRGFLRGVVTKQITKIEADILKPDIKTDELEESIELLNEKGDELKVINSQIESLIKIDELESELESVEEYKEKLTKIKFKTLRLIKKINKESETNNSWQDSNISRNISSSSETQTIEQERIKLPKLTIPKFFGEMSEWLNFWNSFKSAIHENERLNKIDKFNYLRSFLGGSAFNLIDGLELSAEHYDHSIELLKQRFGDKNILINIHIEKLLQTSPLRSSNDVKGFRDMFNHIQKNIRSLESLSVRKDSYSNILVPILTKLFPRDLLLEFNKRKRDTSVCEIDELINFLASQLVAREMTFSTAAPEIKTPARESMKDHSRRQQSSASALINESIQNRKSEGNFICLFCKSNKHGSSYCKDNKLSLEEKIEICKRSGSCFRCLNDKIKKRHLSSACRAELKCERCFGRHVTVMCMGKKRITPGEDISKTKQDTDCVLSNSSDRKKVMLQTLIVGISGANQKHLMRIIIDTGSSCSYVSEFAARRLKLKDIGQELVVHGLFGGLQKREKHKKYVINLSNVDNSFNCTFNVMEQKTICAPIPKLENRELIEEIKMCGIFPSDVTVNENFCLFDSNVNEIHGLIGADYAGKLFTGEIKNLSNGLVAMNTYFGWTIMGRTGESHNTSEVLLSLHVSDLKICDLWSLDSLGITEASISQTRSEIEEAAKNHFVRSLKRDDEGRYQVSLPWLEVHPELPDNRNLAERRLKSCVKMLQKRNCLEEYENVFREWVSEKIIEPVDSEGLTKDKGHYLPHRPVFKENSTTKIRPVFDASAKERNSVSLNDCIEKGPNYLELIPKLINRFRQGKYGVISDIRRAFLQISLAPSDQKFLRFLWWEEGDPRKLIVYSHCRVVFGVSASPFLLAATIGYHLENVVESQRDIALKLKESMYVDNCVASVNTIEELNSFITVSKELMASAQFDLRGWKHNRLNNDEENSILNMSDDEYKEIVSVLGLKWNLYNDTLSCEIKEQAHYVLSKRTVLSVLSQIFDPIGFTCPVTLIPKLILQECWREKINWDTELPDTLGKKFLKWANELKYLKDIEIPRKLPGLDENTTLHVFVDASKSAYAASIFIRNSSEGIVNCQLLQARSKIAPIKPITIPRLEILACTIGARLAYTVKEDLNFKNVPIYFYTDSMNALYWIKKQDNWATFIANRVNEIRKLTDPDDWHHIRGKINPADLPSRGCNPRDLLKSRWWEGPEWLKLPIEEWPTSEIAPDIEVIISEKKRTVISTTNLIVNSFALFQKISSFNKIVRVMAYVIRFCKNIKGNHNERKRGKLEIEEIKTSEKVILKEIQRESFTVKEKLTLRTVKDRDGLLRVETRIASRKDLETFRFPILLPSKHHMVEKLIMDKHLELQHAGVQTLMSFLREYYWIIKSRKTVREVIRNCTKCKRFSVRPLEAVSIPLPEDRVRDAAVFEITGIDLCGPLFLKGDKKCWIVLATCAIYRSVHLELVTSLSTDCFLLAFRRFIARRGRPSTVYSDNGKNLVGAANLLKSIDWEKVEHFASEKRISWKFSPPSAPWWGGFWERLIGLLKNILRKVLGRACLNDEELATVLCDAESLINSRPLTYLSEDPEDLSALTPSMFLQDIRDVGVPDLDMIDSKKLKKRYAYRLKLLHDLRNRFRNEYLGSLRDYSKVKGESIIKEGDLVLIGDTNNKRINWPLAKVIKTYPGKDGRVRVAELKTQFGSLLRPIQKLYPLEITDFPSSNNPISKVQNSPCSVQDPVRYSRYGRILRPTRD